MSCIFNVRPKTKDQRPKTKVFFKKALGKIVVCLVLVGVVFSLVSDAQEQSLGNSAKISLDVKGMDIIDVLKILSDEGGFNLSIGGNVSGRVTLFLKDIDVWDALEIVLVSGNLAYEKKGRIIYVMTERDYELKYGEKYWDKRKVEIFNLKYARASRVKELLSQVASNVGKVIIDEPTNTVVVTDTPDKLDKMRTVVERIDRTLAIEVVELNYLSAEELNQKLSDVLTANVGKVRFDEVSNKVVITDYPDKLKEIKDIIEAFDVKPLQVLIDAKIIELTPSKKFYAGISWEYWIQKYFKTTGTFSFPSTSTDKVTFSSHDTITTSAPGDYSAIMDFLSIFGNTKVLSTPRILVLNNQEAKILVGTKDAYITSTTSEVGDSAVTSQSVNFVDIGVKLYVTPTINRRGYVTLKIRPEVSSSTRTDITSEGQITQIPIVTTSEAETTMIVKEGVSILLGGLRKITHAKEKKQIPILGSIPLVGNIFRNRKDEWTKNELVIVLTPRIVSGDRSIEEEVHDKLVGEMWETEAIEELKGEEQGVSEEIAVQLGNKQKGSSGKEAKAGKLNYSEIAASGEKQVVVGPEDDRLAIAKESIDDLTQKLSELDDKLEQLTQETQDFSAAAVSSDNDSDRVAAEIEDGVEMAQVESPADDYMDVVVEDIFQTDITCHDVTPSGKEEVKKKSLPPAIDDTAVYKYYLQVVEKIRDVSSVVISENTNHFGGNQDREVKLRFVLSCDGELVGEPVVIYSQGGEIIEETAKEIIKQSCPFSVFPEAKNEEREIFEISLYL